jgi:hypothetical protein
MGERVRLAFEASPHYFSADGLRRLRQDAARTGNFDVFFEHGQWFVMHVPTGMAWSVVDASPGIDGFDFEQVCDGDV